VTYSDPLLLFFWCVLLAACVFRRNSRRRTFLVAGGLAGIFLACWLPSAWLFSRPLEFRYPDVLADARGAQAIVVPGAGVDRGSSSRPFPVVGSNTYGRCLMAAWLYRNGVRKPVVVSGFGEAPAMAAMLQNEGVAPSDLWPENSSHSTRENAVASAAMLRARGISRIVVVSEARVMTRARGVFEKLGFQVVPAVWSHFDFPETARDFIPGWRGLRENEITLHETVGLAWYRLRGWI
jgi:uncharacterized SAM-binding protein YcdF (DUF218 family)